MRATDDRGEGDRPRFRLLGVPVDAVQIPDVIELMSRWITTDHNHFIALTTMHGLVVAQRDDGFKRVLDQADLVVPDGMPLVRAARRRGFSLPRRVYGPELMEAFCSETGPAYRHFFYGGAPGVAQDLAHRLEDRYGIEIAGATTPPFRDLTPRETAEEISDINSSGAQIVWVALGETKQGRWMHDRREDLHAQVSVGVGAAFDFLTDRKRSAPRWMKENGFEWLFRLASEPTRLWRRYMIGGARFGTYVVAERLHLKDFSLRD